MFLLFDPKKLIGIVAATYACIFLLFSTTISPWDAFRYAGLVEIFILLFATLGWRKLWERFPKLNYILFPDLNGHWTASIHWVRGEKSGQVIAAATIKQDLFRMSIEMDAPDSDSSTIALVVKRDMESDRPLLHYVYEVTEKQKREDSSLTYKGAASLKVDAIDPKLMQGNYFTARGGKGHFDFKRVR